MSHLINQAVLVVAALALVGCGRSTLWGDQGVQPCPVGQILRDGHCIADVTILPSPDGSTDPNDDASKPDPECIPAGREICDNGIDDDCNNLTDCEDPVCAGTLHCCQQKPEICGNDKDDNCNGLEDCQDPWCAGDSHCPGGHEICNNGLDDDHNGFIDCKDPACAAFAGCQQPTPEICDNGIDDNHNGLTDCKDPACVDAPNCRDLICHPTVDFGGLQRYDSSATRLMDTTGTSDVALTSCAPGGAGMIVSEFDVLSPDTPVRLDFVQGAGSDHAFGFFRSGTGQKCEANPLGCYDPKGALSGHDSRIFDAGHYYLIVQAVTAQHQGEISVTLSTPPSNKPEVCDNGIDDDGNDLTDCADPACASAANCQQCNPNIVLGTLVPGDNPKSARFTTQGAANHSFLTCAAGGGGEVVVQFTLYEAADVILTWRQQGDQVVGLFRKPGMGNACDALPLSCFDPNGNPDTVVDWTDLGPGDYLLVFQALQSGTEGVDEITLEAYKNRDVELCHNGLDDDNNGKIDCLDPACSSDPGCGAPLCIPDVNLGTLTVDAPPRVLTLNTTNGVANETLSCAHGGGRSRIVQLTLEEPSGIIVGCDDPGDQVMGLFLAQGARDACDKLELVCADLKNGPFGCNFEIPNLAPGVYYLIFEAFQAGAEGKIRNLSLAAEGQRQGEICDNGIDDDGDGFTDCADRKCATSAYCQALACNPDEIFDPLPTTTPPTPTAWSMYVTSSLPATVAPPCAATAGGGAVILSINLPHAATLAVDYMQYGQNVFALYPVLAPGLLCDAAPAQACTLAPTGPQSSGAVTFTNLAIGKYYLAVVANSPTPLDQGPVSLRLTATPTP